MNTKTKEIVGDTINNVKFSAISWKSNDGFYYSSYEAPEGSKLSSKTDQHILYYHKLGTKQKSDKVIFGAVPYEKNRYVRGYVTDDDRFLVVDAAIKTTGNKLLIKDLKNNSTLKSIVDNYDSNNYVLDNYGSDLIIVTDHNAPNKKIVKTTFNNPSQNHWVDLIPEKEFVMTPSTCGGYIFTKYMIDAISKVYQYNYNGKLVREVNLPGIGSAGGFSGERSNRVIF